MHMPQPRFAALRAAIRGAANGEVIFGAQLAARMLSCFTTPASASPPAFPQLTDREREVLNLVAQDRANPAIAAKLGCAITCRTSCPGCRPLNGPRPSCGPGTAVPGLWTRVYRRARERSRRTRDVCLMTAGQPPAEAVFSGRSGGLPEHDAPLPVPRGSDQHHVAPAAAGRGCGQLNPADARKEKTCGSASASRRPLYWR
jgi:hypothetical protein